MAAVAVPLIVKCPGFGGNRYIAEQVQHVDIMPTILDLLDIPVNRESQGNSFRKLIEGDTQEVSEFAYSQAFTTFGELPLELTSNTASSGPR